jgi:hypothetical protein
MLENKVLLAIVTSSQKTRRGYGQKISADGCRPLLSFGGKDVLRTGSRIGVSALDEVVGQSESLRHRARADHKVRPHRCVFLRGPGGNRTCKTMYSTPAVERVLFPTLCVRIFVL